MKFFAINIYSKKVCLVPILSACLFSNSGISQTKTIDSLKKILPSLKDTARIECLASIGHYYTYDLDTFNNDSSVYYLNLIYQESKKINYAHGIAEAYMGKSVLANFISYDFLQAEQLAKEALKWFSLTSNKNRIPIAYWQLSRAQSKQADYDDALTNAKLCCEWAKKTGDDSTIGPALETMTDVYRERGEYDKLFEAQKELIVRDRSEGDSGNYSFHELWVMGLMYMLLEEYPEALSYWRKLFSGSNNKLLNAWNLTEYAQLLTLANERDSALYYYDLFDSAKAQISHLRYFLVSKGEYYLFLKQYNTALPYFLKGLIYHRQVNDHTQIKRTLIDIAKTYLALYNNDSATSYARQGLSMALQTKSKPAIRDGYEILYTVYDRLHRPDSAFFYYHGYIVMKEDVLNEQTKGKIATYKYEHQIELMDKERLISDQHLKIQQQQLEQEALQKKILAAGIISLLLIGGIIFRSITLKRKNEKLRLENKLQVQKLENQKQLSELEIQALRAQMNPHFIFNCLNSINSFIINNNAAQAADYLTKFAKLIRIVLEQSGKSFVLLEDEIACLKLYMDLEALRFEKPFQYKIDLNGTDASLVMIPTLLLQPFVENAIWHGLQSKNDGTGKININISSKDDILYCTICDNGIGRAATVVKEKTDKKSLGINLTEHRLQLIDPLSKGKIGIEIHDLTNDVGHNVGTRVDIKIPVKTI
jgi:tetratricopeptide (TPR) repeat protein